MRGQRKSIILCQPGPGARIGSIISKRYASPVTVEKRRSKTAVGVIDPGAGLITFNRIKKTGGVFTFL